MSGDRRFEKLLEPFNIGPVKTRNRIIKSAADLRLWLASEVHLPERSRYYYEALAKGGVGLLIVEGPVIDGAVEIRNQKQMRFRIDDDKYIPGLSELTQVIHKHSCPTFIQLSHYGPWQETTEKAGPPVAASSVRVRSEMDNNSHMARPLTIPEIQDIEDKFASAAVRAQQAGFDGVEINAASSHLLHTFLSPFWNKRQDNYGGSPENRARFLTEIIKEMKNRLGKQFPISIIVNGLEVGKLIGVEDSECLTGEDSRKIAVLLQEAGADAIQVRSYWIGRHAASFLTDHLCYPEPPIPLKQFPREFDWSRHGAGANVLLAAAMKKILSIPVITVGRLGPELGEQVLREGKADFICLNRRLFADPELPNKIASGRLEDIAPCTSCTCCLRSDRPRQCRINGFIGTEQSYVIEPAAKKKRVVVVGGGSAGMEAARVAALRGHEVILFEKTRKLGGLIPMAAMVKGLEVEDLPAIIQYLEGQLTKLGVKVRLGAEADAAIIRESKPDALILATGGIPVLPDIAGINRRNVVGGPDLHRMLKSYLRFVSPNTLRWLTRFWLPIGKKVVIIGGGIQGCELAEFLVKRGRKVTIVDTVETLGAGMVEHLKLQLFWWFRQKGVTMMPGVKYVEITDKGLVIITNDGYNQTLEADSIVPAMPLKPNASLYKSLEGKIKEIYSVGDCRDPQLIVDAIADGFRVARAI